MFFLCEKKNEGFREKCSTPSGPSHVLFREMLGGSVGHLPSVLKKQWGGWRGRWQMVKAVGRAEGDEVGVMWTRPCWALQALEVSAFNCEYKREPKADTARYGTECGVGVPGTAELQMGIREGNRCWGVSQQPCAPHTQLSHSGWEKEKRLWKVCFWKQEHMYVRNTHGTQGEERGFASPIPLWPWQSEEAERGMEDQLFPSG